MMISFGGATLVRAQEQTTLEEQKNYQAVVTEILEQKIGGEMVAGELWQKLELTITSKGELATQTITIENRNPNTTYQIGDKVMVYQASQDTFLIADQVRTDALLILFVIFIALVLLISKWRGLGSLIGMAISFAIIIYFILPKIASGSNPILIAILGSIIIIPATFYPSHGINRKSSIAIISTIIALLITGFLANYFIDFAKLTGLASEEAGFLQAMYPGLINLKGLLLAGIIIGVLGVLDDVTVSQASIVEQLKGANPNLKTTEVYKRAMQVGHDHISSVVNTLVLVYAGASLPLLLLFNDAARPFAELVNYEMIAEEIIRTLVGSIGLILAVPISTLLAAWFVEGKVLESGDSHHHHHHHHTK
jgi:uncharacterized membrane protein